MPSVFVHSKPWDGAAVSLVLGREIYVGDLEIYKKLTRNIITGEIDPIQAHRYIENHHEGIVDRELWEKVKRLRESRKPKSIAEYREPVYELRIQGLEMKEIAEQLGISEGVVNSTVAWLREYGRLEKRPPAHYVESVRKLMEEEPRLTMKEMAARLGLMVGKVNYAKRVLRKSSQKVLQEKARKGLNKDRK